LCKRFISPNGDKKPANRGFDSAQPASSIATSPESPDSAPTPINIILNNANEIHILIHIKSNRYWTIRPYDVGSRHTLTADALGQRQPLHFWRGAELDCDLQDIESISSLDLAIFGDIRRKPFFLIELD